MTRPTMLMVAMAAMLAVIACTFNEYAQSEILAENIDQ